MDQAGRWAKNSSSPSGSSMGEGPVSATKPTAPSSDSHVARLNEPQRCDSCTANGVAPGTRNKNGARLGVVVVRPVRGFRPERLGRAVRRDHDDTARAARVERCGARAAQVVLGGRVHHGVVHEHGVELPPESYRPHVAAAMLALGVQAAAHSEHVGRQVDQRHLEMCLQVARVVPFTAPQLEHISHGRVGGLQQARGEGRFLAVVLRRRDDWPPHREVVVEPKAVGRRVHPRAILAERRVRSSRQARRRRR